VAAAVQHVASLVSAPHSACATLQQAQTGFLLFFSFLFFSFPFFVLLFLSFRLLSEISGNL
jgi:hypothetical protein